MKVNIGLLDPIYVLGSCLGFDMKGSTCKNTQNSCATAYIKHYFVLEKMRIFGDGVHVGFGPDGILEHFFMDGKMGISIKVVIGILNVANNWLCLFFGCFLSLLFFLLRLFRFHLIGDKYVYYNIENQGFLEIYLLSASYALCL